MKILLLRVTLLISVGLILLGLGAVQAANQPSQAHIVASVAKVSQAEIERKIAPSLRALLASQPGSVHYLLIMQEQADTSNTISPLQWGEKGEYVYHKLQEVADRSQPPVLDSLRGLAASVQVSSYQPFWIVNAIYVEGSPGSVTAIAALPQVTSLEAAPDFYFAPEPAPAASQPGSTAYAMPHVPAYSGSGITIGSIDAGALYTHEAISRQYRGAQSGSQDYNWFDPIAHSPMPVDNYLWHGTRTISRALGRNADGSVSIGLAPEANWISCRAGTSTLPSYAILSCGQFMLAPTNRNGGIPRPELRPQVVSNSYGNSDGTITFLNPMIDNWINAGIFPSFSVGNHSGTGVVESPASYHRAFAVGSVDLDNSAKGPSPMDGSIKPEVASLGSQVQAATGPGESDYAIVSGTSYSQPDAAGTVARLLSKNRSLTVGQLEMAITSTTYFTSCANQGPQPNNSCGWGEIRNVQALNSVAALNGTLVGRVTDAGGNGIAAASVRVSGAGSLSSMNIRCVYVPPPAGGF